MDLLIDVEDNGLGMRPELAASLLDEDRPEVRTKGSGIGTAPPGPPEPLPAPPPRPQSP